MLRGVAHTLTIMGLRSPTIGAKYLMITMTQSTGRDPRWLTMTLGAGLVRLLPPPPRGPMAADAEPDWIWPLPAALGYGLSPWASAAARRWWVRRRVLALSMKFLL